MKGADTLLDLKIEFIEAGFLLGKVALPGEQILLLALKNL